MIGVEPSASEVTFPGYATNIPPTHQDLEGQTAEGTLWEFDIDTFINSHLAPYSSDPDRNYSFLAANPSGQHVSQSSADAALLSQAVSALPHYGQAKLALQLPRGAFSSASSNVSVSSESSPLPSPAPSEKSKAIPRHKRPSHQRAEVKRRNTIKDRLAELGASIGSPESKKISEIEILTKAAGITRNLMGQKSEMNHEVEQLRSQKQALNAELAEMQKGLPPMGFVKEANLVTMNELYKAATEQKTAAHSEKSENSETFIVLRKCLDSLFERFKEATAGVKNESELKTAAFSWASEASMTSLRSAVTAGCLDLVKAKPTILNEPAMLPRTRPQSGYVCTSAPADSTTSADDQEMIPVSLEGMLDAATLAQTSQATDALAFPMVALPSISGASVEMVKLEEESFLLDCALPLSGDSIFDVNLPFNFDILTDSQYSFSFGAEAPMGGPLS